MKKLTKQQRQFYNQCKKQKFEQDQLQVVLQGLSMGLDLDKVYVYARNCFDYYQMRQILLGFQCRLTLDEILVYAKKEFNEDQMESIRNGFLEGLDIEKVSIYARQDLPYEEMLEIRESLKFRPTKEQILLLKKYPFDYEQIGQICNGFINGLSVQMVSKYAIDKYGQNIMILIRQILESKPDSSFVDYILAQDMDEYQLSQINQGMKLDGLSEQQVKIYAKKEFDADQMQQIRHGFLDRLSIKQVLLYARPEFTEVQMEKVREMFEKYKRFSTVQNKVALMVLQSE